MEFRWAAALALWTILSGPVFSGLGSRSLPLEHSPRAAAANQQRAYQPHGSQPSGAPPYRAVFRPVSRP
ncbi:MAG TPA: hypothetical protein VG013_37370 [Gemmataceae bacterium]|jgi:hypothetical protein|nr:hypothetical protein [Gemmataceae bacterium]